MAKHKITSPVSNDRLDNIDKFILKLAKTKHITPHKIKQKNKNTISSIYLSN